MGIIRLIVILYRTKLLTPLGLFRLVTAITSNGANLMALLALASKAYGSKIALIDDGASITYRELLQTSEALAFELRGTYGIQQGSKVGFLCKNHISLVQALFAASRCGGDIYLMNAEIGSESLQDCLTDIPFDLIIHDPEAAGLLERSSYNKATLLASGCRATRFETGASDQVQHETAERHLRKGRLKPSSAGRLLLLTGGTTGKAKMAPHKPALFGYLAPMSTLLAKLRLMTYESGYIATPIYHGYGIAMLLLFTALGKKTILARGFEAAKACELISQHKVEVTTVVPLMLQRMLKHDSVALRSLKCIAAGGAELSPSLAAEARKELGGVVFNLYGTSEAGLAVVATPQDLARHPETIGKKIPGVPLAVLNRDGDIAAADETGELCLLPKRLPFRRVKAARPTGDLGRRDREGYFYLCGRVDDMIVSGGENVYPVELERVLLRHPLIADAAVVGVRDEVFGERLKAFVQSHPDAGLSGDALMEWLRSRAARYQQPKEIVFVEELPYTHLGKRDKKRLIAGNNESH